MTTQQVVRVASLVVAAACARPSPAPPAERAANTVSSDVDGEAVCVAAARACAHQVLVENADGIVDCMPDETVNMLGGRGAILALMRQGNAELADGGAHFEQALIDPPSVMTKSGKRTFAILPQETVLSLPEGHLHQKGYLVGVSSDDGRTWKFVDGVKLNRRIVQKIFPDFPASITLPTVGEPQLR